MNSEISKKLFVCGQLMDDEEVIGLAGCDKAFDRKAKLIVAADYHNQYVHIAKDRSRAKERMFAIPMTDVEWLC